MRFRRRFGFGLSIMGYLRHYYITLCGEYRGKFVDIMATDKNVALDSVIKVYGILNVSRVYTEKAWQLKYTDIFTYAGYIESEEERKEKEERRRRRYGAKLYYESV